MKAIHGISQTRWLKELDRKIFSSLSTKMSRKFKRTETTQQSDEKVEVLDTHGQMEEMKSLRKYGFDK